ncbi:ADP-ribose pyrophosphatase [Actinoalloteichus fjordicus]|uniref:ADP-ribose pyrophosphatase n=1 Tax=Actinoalloteichus fjordicus TaxID=1612552 RepID=A0AAC9LAX3_9PSEU|nr:ADP-ribose pyrophosphatase [Actinoalloteichus fjordicus]
MDKVAWVRLTDRRILSARTRGRDVFYFPGGKREPGESDVETLVREVREELAVEIVPDTARRLGTFETQAHGKPAGVLVRLTCYTAEAVGTPTASMEIEEIALLSYADRERVSAVDKIVFDHLHEQGLLA